ncbi:MAG: carboxypeptidase-like regulatory domain-containing protein [Leadbetterella sp.]|nr:carboxypeptidase-like regulatory domain-containing protein [Leadbetterella sp.]
MEVDLPGQEGQNLPPSAVQALQMGDFANTYPITKVARVVALDRTNAQGKVTVPRVIRIDSRKSDSFIAHSYSDKNVGVYSKSDGIKVLNAVSLPQGIILDQTDPAWDVTPEFNSFYKYNSSSAEIVMASKSPVVKGKVVEKNMALKGVQVVLKTRVTTVKETVSGWLGWIKEEVKTTEWKPLAALITKEDGYFEFKNLSPGDYLLEFSKSGYKPVLYPAGSTLFSFKPFSLKSGQLLQTNDISMSPSGSITACVSDEDGNRVVADIRVDEGAYYKTLESGVMKGCVVNMPAPGGTGRKIKVSPRASDVFFDEEFLYTIKEEGVTNVPAGTLMVLRRKHRLRMQVNGKQGNNVMPLQGATVTVKEYSAVSDSKGVALLEFESPGTEFVVRVQPADHFSHWEKEMTIPVTKKPVERTAELSPARTVLATVTGNMNGKTGPSEGARVYIKTLKSGWGNNSSNYAECITDGKGQCTLKGIPVTENNLEVFVAKESANGTFVGEKKEAYWMNGQFQAKVNLTLSFKSGFKINDVWGFPVNIETAEVQTNGTYLVSGSFRDIPGNPNFTDTDSRLDFKNIRFVPAALNGNTHQPEKETVTVEQKSFRVKVGKGLQGMVTPRSIHHPYSLTFPKINVTKSSQGKAELKAAVKLELSSFEGAYQLSGKIEIGENLNPDHVLVFSANNLAKRKLNLGSSGAGGTMTNLKYKVHNFNAEAEAVRSYISGDSVNLFTVLHTDIRDMSPADLAIQAGYITVLPDRIVPFSGGDDIRFSLEKWKVTGQKPASGQVWKYDKNNGGISIDKAVVNTGIVAVSLNQVIIKPDRLIADKLDLNSADAGAFSLGGIVPLEVLPGTQTLFAYDPNCYHDNKPHWKLTLAGKSGTVAARVSQLEGLAANDKLEFGSMNLFSDNRQQLSGPSAKKLTLFKVLNFSLNTIDVGKDFFTLVGQAGMDIPNMTAPGGGGITGQIVYSKNPSGQVKADIRPLYFQVEGKGQVTFKADDAASSQTIADGLYTSGGTLKIYDTPGGKAFEVSALLKHQKTTNGYNTSIEVLEKQKIPLEGKFLEIKPGLANSSMKVAGGAWEHLVLSTVLPEGSFQNMSEKEAERSLTFVVKGALETDPSKGKLGVTGMDTGFGNMSLFYNFAKQEVRGDFTMNIPGGIPCGIVNITSVGGAVVIGTGGMYMRTSAVGQIALAGLPAPVHGTVNLLLGYYNKPLYPDDLDAMTSLAVNKSYPDQLKSGIKGMYSSFTLSASKELGDIDKSIPGTEVGFLINAGIGFEYRNFVNFASASRFYVESGMYGYGHAGIAASATVLGTGG